jgi:hypothetical protein
MRLPYSLAYVLAIVSSLIIESDARQRSTAAATRQREAQNIVAVHITSFPGKTPPV